MSGRRVPESTLGRNHSVKHLGEDRGRGVPVPLPGGEVRQTCLGRQAPPHGPGWGGGGGGAGRGRVMICIKIVGEILSFRQAWIKRVGTGVNGQWVEAGRSELRKRSPPVRPAPTVALAETLKTGSFPVR